MNYQAIFMGKCGKNFYRKLFGKAQGKVDKKRRNRGMQNLDETHPPILFDATWYAMRYPDASLTGLDPLTHYLKTGWKEGCQPHPLFDSQYYLRNHADVADAGLEPCLHYLKNGWMEGREPHPLFSGKWYLKTNPDVAATKVQPLIHYLEHGWMEGREPHPLFSSKWYLETNPDVAATKVQPLIHYLEHGWMEGREPHPLFSSKWYLETNPGVAATQVQPLIHYLEHGWMENHFPNPHFDPQWYIEQYSAEIENGENPLSHYATQGWRRGNKPNPLFDPKKYLEDHPDLIKTELEPLAHYLANPSCPVPEVHEVLEDWLGPQFRPLPVYLLPGEELRLNMITDGIERNSLFGGVGTAIFLSALLAKRWKCPLRVITRSEKPVPANFGDVLEANGISHEGRVDFIYADANDSNSRVAITPQDVFLTTSHWTTHSVLESVNANKIIYLLQEDERMFYPEGDQRLRATQVMTHESLTTVINTRLLYDHLCSEGFSAVQRNGIWFEPSFPKAQVVSDDTPQAFGGKKMKFLFYARPNNLRNLYYFGLDIIRAAILKGILDPEQWEFYFIGKDLTPIKFPADVSPQLLKPMAWAEYRSLMRQMDLGLCLMSTPHPSYPPLDLASEGAVAVTNSYGNKKSLSQYSDNILCGEPTLQGMLDALKCGVDLACSPEQRHRNLSGDHLNRDWAQSFSKTLEQLTEQFCNTALPS